MQNALWVGAHQQVMSRVEQSDWHDMTTAPRDGTVIEIMCTYGVAPHYDLYKWTDISGAFCLTDGRIVEFNDGRKSWKKARDASVGLSGESTMRWRLYSGAIDSYIDPTGGAQNEAAYWRGAVAQKYGLPLDHFEKRVAASAAAIPAPRPTIEPKKASWLRRLFQAMQ